MPRVLGWYPLHEDSGGENRFGVDMSDLGSLNLLIYDGIVEAGPSAVATFGGLPFVFDSGLSVFRHDNGGVLTLVDTLDLEGYGTGPNSVFALAGAPGYVASLRAASGTMAVDLFEVDGITGTTEVYNSVSTSYFGLSPLIPDGGGGMPGSTFSHSFFLGVGEDGAVWVFVRLRRWDTQYNGALFAWHITPAGVIDADPTDGFFLAETTATGRTPGADVEAEFVSDVDVGVPIVIDETGLAPFTFIGDPGGATAPYRARGFVRCNVTDGLSYDITSSDRVDAPPSTNRTDFLTGCGRSGDIAPIRNARQVNLNGSSGAIGYTEDGTVATGDAILFARFDFSDVVQPVARSIEPTGAVNVVSSATFAEATPQQMMYFEAGGYDGDPATSDAEVEAYWFTESGYSNWADFGFFYWSGDPSWTSIADLLAWYESFPDPWYIDDGFKVRRYRDGAYPERPDQSYDEIVFPGLNIEPQLRARWMLWVDDRVAWIYPGDMSEVPSPDVWQFPADWDYDDPPDDHGFLFLLDFSRMPTGLTVGPLKMRSGGLG